MFLHVQTQVVTASERALAQLTLERALSGVLPVVTGQFVGARELPAAALPGAVVRLLPGVRAQVRLEVRALGVHLLAVVVGTGVDDGAFLGPGAAPPPHDAT